MLGYLIAIIVIIALARFILFLIPNLAWTLIWIIVAVAAIAALVCTVVLLGLIILKKVKNAPTEEITKYVQYLKYAAIAAAILCFTNNHIMPAVSNWIVELTDGLVGVG